MNCLQCAKELTGMGVTARPSKEGKLSIVNLYWCFNQDCPNFCLAQA